MLLDHTSRLVIIGNSGSGKSTLAQGLAERAGLPIHHLDPIHWERHGVKRDTALAKALVAEIAITDAWIMEGVFGWLVEEALPFATCLIWLDLPWDVCRERLLRRSLIPSETEDDQRNLLAWAGEYWTRTTASSFAGHGALYDAFGESKFRLRSRDEADRLLEGPPGAE